MTLLPALALWAAATVATTPATFSDSTEGLPEARPTETVELTDGATFTLTVSIVKQKVAGTWIRRLAYNGSVPGPTFRVKQGTTARVTLRNESDIPTTLHPHGLRVDDKNDGVVGIGQPKAVGPGESHEYLLKFTDPGVFWYHPHVRDDYSQDMGLYGNILIAPKEKDYFSDVHREVTLALDDVAIGNKAPYFKNRVTHTLMGRYGDVMLINGQDNFRLAATEGEVMRFFITNTANTRTLNFAIPGARMKLVGSDNGLYERERFVESIIIGPSERYIVEVSAPKVGTFNIVNAKPNGATKLGTIDVTKGAVRKLSLPFERLRSPTPAAEGLKQIRGKLGKSIDFTLALTLTVDHKALPMNHSMAKATKGAGRAIEWEDGMAATNAASDDANVTWQLVDQKTKKANMAINWQLKKGDFVKIRVVNDPKSMHPMQHPLHFHGQRFVVAAVDGKVSDNLAWKDSVLIAPGETMDLVLEASNPGRWMAHCHIAEHLGAGMMLGFEVAP